MSTELAQERGYEGVGFVCYDRNDGPEWLFKNFNWKIVNQNQDVCTTND